MRGFRWLAALAVLSVAGVSLAQVGPMRIPRPPAAVMVQPADAMPASQLNFSDPELMRAQIQRLKKQKRELRLQLQTTVADLQSVRTRLDEMTRAGGSLVTAQCAAPSLSRNTAGAQEDCSASGYMCEPVSGFCRRSCDISDQCSAGFRCDTGARRCTPEPTAAPDE